jgi:hypothetical protein
LWFTGKISLAELDDTGTTFHFEAWSFLLLLSGNRASVPAHVLIRHLDGEAVLLNLESERYFGLDGTGTRMLDLITTMPSIDAAYEKLLEEFEVEPARLRENVNELLGRLVENGLLNLSPADVGTTPAV